jgi:hypothetical protein
MTCDGVKSSAPAGTCGAIAYGASAPAGQCPAAPPCGNDGTCDGEGACAVTHIGTPCGGTPACSQGLFDPGDACDGNSGCVAAAPGPCPGDLACAPNQMVCLTACAVDGDCVPGDFCVNPGPSGVCSAPGAPGAPCSANAQCGTGVCGVEGGGTHCCAQTCATGGCGATDCDATGACVFASPTTSCSATSCAGNALTTFTLCDGFGACGGGAAVGACPGDYSCASSFACGSSCAGASDCAPQTTLCKVSGCQNGSCFVSNAPLGTACTDSGGTTCDGMGDCLPAKYVFVTSAVIPADLGSALANDAKCQSTAAGVGLAGTWVSWTSDGSTSPSTRFTQWTGSYLRLDGTMVASGWSGLTSGSLMASISVTELGASAPGYEVWTATDTAGAYAGSSCNNWTQAIDTLITPVGDSSDTDSSWTNVYEQFCNYGYQHLYCFQQ